MDGHAEIWVVLGWVAVGVGTAALGALGWLVKSKVTALDLAIASIRGGLERDIDLLAERVNKSDATINGIEKNYVQRFDEMKTMHGDTREQLLGAIADLKLSIGVSFAKAKARVERVETIIGLSQSGVE